MIRCAIHGLGRDCQLSNPSGDYSFAGLGFTGLQFFQDGNQHIGYLNAPRGRIWMMSRFSQP